MRLFVYCLLLATSHLLAAQSSEELHTRYGEPDQERFSARPGISLTVEYGADRLACKLLVERTRSLLTNVRPRARSESGKPESQPTSDRIQLHTELQNPPPVAMSSDVVTEILEELVPLTSRGSEVRSFTIVSGANRVHIVDYENDLSMARSTHDCSRLKPNCEEQATVTFKRDASETSK
jgi:hypothetical protein